MLNLITCIIIFFVQAHEGDHGISQFHAKNNGIVQSIETLHLEFVSNGEILRVYAYDLNEKPTQVAKFPIQTKILLPLKKTEAISFIAKDTYWEATYKAPTSIHRYTLEFKIEQNGHKDTLQFTVEQGKKK